MNPFTWHQVKHRVFLGLLRYALVGAGQVFRVVWFDAMVRNGPFGDSQACSDLMQKIVQLDLIDAVNGLMEIAFVLIVVIVDQAIGVFGMFLF